MYSYIFITRPIKGQLVECSWPLHKMWNKKTPNWTSKRDSTRWLNLSAFFYIWWSILNGNKWPQTSPRGVFHWTRFSCSLIQVRSAENVEALSENWIPFFSYSPDIWLAKFLDTGLKKHAFATKWQKELLPPDLSPDSLIHKAGLLVRKRMGGKVFWENTFCSEAHKKLWNLFCIPDVLSKTFSQFSV